MSNDIRVAIVDDHEVVRLGLRNMIERQPDMTVSHELDHGQIALNSLPHQTDVVILDIRMPEMNGIEVCRELHAQDSALKIIVLTSFGDDETVIQAVAAGAASYLLKESRGGSIIQAIRTVAAGGSLFGPEIAHVLLTHLRHKDHNDPIETLSEQELRILGLVAQGKTNKEIGQIVFLSDKTIKHYVSQILTKLSCQRRSEAAAIWAKHQIHPSK